MGSGRWFIEPPTRRDLLSSTSLAGQALVHDLELALTAATTIFSALPVPQAAVGQSP